MTSVESVPTVSRTNRVCSRPTSKTGWRKFIDLYIFKQPEIVVHRHIDDLHVTSNNEDGYFYLLGNHHWPLCTRVMINKMITLGSHIFAASGFKYSDLDLIARGLDSRCHTASSMGVKPTSSFRDIKTP